MIIIDVFTDGYSEDLHQALEAKEAKEGVQVEMENQALASITFQNFLECIKNYLELQVQNRLSLKSYQVVLVLPMFQLHDKVLMMTYTEVLAKNMYF